MRFKFEDLKPEQKLEFGDVIELRNGRLMLVMGNEPLPKAVIEKYRKCPKCFVKIVEKDWDWCPYCGSRLFFARIVEIENEEVKKEE